MTSLEGKVAIVTGASSGIGHAIAAALVGAGMKVAGLARRAHKVEELAQSLSGKSGKLVAVKCDVTSEEDIKNAFQWVEKNLGPPTAVINNAGVLVLTLVSQSKMEDVKRMYDTNIVGLIACAKEALNSMVNHKTEGTIININSVAGQSVLPFPANSAFTGSKFAVTALSASLRNEVSLLGANVRVTSISPGTVLTQFTSGSSSPKLLVSDIVDCVFFVLQSPQRMNVSELSVSHLEETSLYFAQLAGARDEPTSKKIGSFKKTQKD